MVWPEQVVLGIIGRRPDEVSLVWATGLASRWGSQLHVVAGYHPPIGMFPHIVTEREKRAAHQRARRHVATRTQQAVGGLAAPIEVRQTVVTHNQLDHTIATQASRAGLLLFSIAPTGVLVRRHRARAQRIAAFVGCPASLGPGQAVELPAGYAAH
ncbi:hypothetical protein [Janibacter cremeus]|uniref:Universal stress protein n=1 Tax=Janibacter cremeus TaxID=1285192 RepID=A0A852VYK5_9MICO|nr:hypothetical protein [Janibacter cremeus]NYF98581.1 hypothetical protein [Janibacter cremeus]